MWTLDCLLSTVVECGVSGVSVDLLSVECGLMWKRQQMRGRKRANFRLSVASITIFSGELISTLAGAPFQARKANYLIGVFVCLLKLEGSR